MTQPLACLVLAAGKGTRMKSRLPKLLHTACGRPLLGWSLAAVEPLGADPVVVIVPPDQPELDALVNYVYHSTNTKAKAKSKTKTK